MSEEYISGEEYQEMQRSYKTNNPRGKRVTVSTRTLSTVVMVVLLCALSFLGGTIYQRHSTPKVAAVAATTGTNGTPGFGGGFQRGAGSFGQVTAISSSSIGLSNQRTGTTDTYTITSATTITDNGQTVTTDDIKTGDTVVIMTSTSDTSTATRILVNPSFGGPTGAGAAAPTTTDGTSSN